MNITYCDVCLKPKVYGEDTRLFAPLGSFMGLGTMDVSLVICRQCVADFKASAEARERSIRAATGGDANV